MAERTVTIASKTGLHARPAGIFAKAAEQQPATVTIEKPGGNAVQASSMLMLMTLGAAQGDEVTLRAEGEGAEEDRKSTRLNSSHVAISYAVFCLKKKTEHKL